VLPRTANSTERVRHDFAWRRFPVIEKWNDITRNGVFSDDLLSLFQHLWTNSHFFTHYRTTSSYIDRTCQALAMHLYSIIVALMVSTMGLTHMCDYGTAGDGGCEQQHENTYCVSKLV
jgi:hypothetical protein